MIIFYASQFFTPVCTITFFLPIDLSHFITYLKKISRKFFECLTSIWLSLHLNVQVVLNLPTHPAVLTSLSCLSIFADHIDHRLFFGSQHLKILS